ncbi:MAG: sigma-70 family RNA polymerase sigma factor [Acidobacteriota bacterium]
MSLERFQLSSDEELMEQLQRGQADALAVLFDRHYRLVYSVALRILHDHGEAEDLMQEVFLEIYRKAELYQSTKGSAKTWILQYAYHRSLNRQKYLNLRKFYDAPATLESWDVPYRSHGWNGLSYRDWESVIQKGMECLTEKEHQTLTLVYFQGLLLKEIAEQLDESLPNVRNHYYRGMKKLREFLKDQSCFKKQPA